MRAKAGPWTWWWIWFPACLKGCLSFYSETTVEPSDDPMISHATCFTSTLAVTLMAGWKDRGPELTNLNPT